MRTLTDQMHRTMEVPELPQRIISLVPSQTELLYDIGLGERVVGITKFCIHPETWFNSKHRVGGTKKVDMDKEYMRTLVHSMPHRCAAVIEAEGWHTKY